MAQWLVGGLDDLTQPALGKASRLVFVCLGNINRSCFAEAVARRAGAPAVSIGLSTTTGIPAFHTAVDTARLFGLDLTRHRTTDLADFVPQEGDLLLVMEVRHVRRLRQAGLGHLPIALLGAWSRPMRIHLHDPHTLSSEYFATCFAQIDSATRGLVHAWRGARDGASS